MQYCYVLVIHRNDLSPKIIETESSVKFIENAEANPKKMKPLKFTYEGAKKKKEEILPPPSWFLWEAMYKESLWVKGLAIFNYIIQEI